DLRNTWRLGSCQVIPFGFKDLRNTWRLGSCQVIPFGFKDLRNTWRLGSCQVIPFGFKDLRNTWRLGSCQVIPFGFKDLRNTWRLGSCQVIPFGFKDLRGDWCQEEQKFSNIRRSVPTCINIKSCFTETALLLSGKFSKMRTMNDTQDIRRNLRLRYPKDPAKERSQQYCVVFEVTKSHHKCSPLGKDATKLKKGERVCVACETAAMRKHLGYRCKGHGVDGKSTRWAALDASSCHGRWVKISEHSACTCNTAAVPDFIFV
ncbi:uncharacterized protein LOC106469051, partial [Limulus polyphemus]|uniref:Uncharacterized protein LOC106469051 n=1 Tax=Limulus polyphemus TaxID=6850 RepID=A0ABM1TBA0_LIMPO